MSGAARLGNDYTLSGTQNQIVIPAGQATGATILQVTTTKTKGSEKATMTLTSGSGYNLPAGFGKRKKTKPPHATVTIQNK